MAEIKAPDGIVPDAQQTLARALAQLGPVGNTWDVGAPSSGRRPSWTVRPITRRSISPNLLKA